MKWLMIVTVHVILSGCYHPRDIPVDAEAGIGQDASSVDSLGTRDANAGTETANDSLSSKPGFVFSVLTTKVILPLVGKTSIDVAVQRIGGFKGAISISGASLPTGVKIEPLTIAENATQGEVVLGATTPLSIGDKVTFKLAANAAGIDEKTITLNDTVVTGKPGAWDVSFGSAGTGFASISFGSDDAGAFDDLEIRSGKIIVVGTGFGGLGGSRMTMTMFTALGQIDSSFNNGELLRTGFASSTADYVYGRAIGHQTDGRLIGIGWREAGSSAPPDIALVRTTITGQAGGVDFGANGKSLINLGGQETVEDGLVQTDNKTLIVGTRDSRFYIARATSTGMLDTTFASPNGYVLDTEATPSAARAIALDGNDRILAAGFINKGGQSDILVRRYNADGAADLNFGNQGRLICGSSTANERAVGLAVMADGRILVAGDSTVLGNTDFEVRRLLANGAIDESFGQKGVATFAITSGDDQAEDLLLLPDGKILVIGNSVSGAKQGPVVARYTREGKLDAFFGNAGVEPVVIGDYGVIHAVVQYDQYKVVIAGGNQGGMPGPGTFGVVVRLWM